MTAPPEREKRSTMDIVVELRFPFPPRSSAEPSMSPLRLGDEVDVVGMDPE